MDVYYTPEICEKESLSEYGSGWEWDSTYAHVFDYTKKDIDIPEKYTNSRSTTAPTINGTWVDYGSASSSEVKFPFCNTETTDGQLLFSGSQHINNISCEPHSYNAGNFYNFPAASASTPEPATSSICPKGWSLPDKYKKTDYSSFLTSYNIDYNASSRTNQDSALLNLPLSYLRSGRYDASGSLDYQSINGFYRAASSVLIFNSGYLDPAYGTYANNGNSVRCVSR